ncbi:MAG TPA: formylglycine-generating enzyme family protein [Candidatus Hydrogenedentes bacterium]|nr:formylglycine-generating enzyme family protein [Candidatus Hydrogenedentota bacterium]
MKNSYTLMPILLASLIFTGCSSSTDESDDGGAENEASAIGSHRTGEVREFDGMEFVWIPKGSFTMGSPNSEDKRKDNERQHKVTLTNGFWLGKYEVTQAEWKSVMGNSPSSFSGSNNPVEQVSWDDIQGYLSKKGSEYRLPTEAEWEYACRAGTTTATHYGNSLSSSQANFYGNSPYGGASKGAYRKKTTSVGSFKPNAWGLYDMHGNVWEWCSDWYGDYSSGSVTGPTGASSGSSRVLRGGSWYNSGYDCRSANRSSSTPGYRYNYIGIRIARTP